MDQRTRSAFAHLQPTTANHFLLHVYAAVFRGIHGLYQLGAGQDEFLAEQLATHSFLQGYLDEMGAYLPPDLTWEAALAWWEDQIGQWEQPHRQRLPLCALADAGIDFQGRMALMLVGLTEEDVRFGTLFAHLHQPLTARRPSWELVRRLLSHAGDDTWRTLQTLLQAGLLQVVRPDLPRAEWELQVPREIWDVIRDALLPTTLSWCTHQPVTALRPLATLHQDPAWLAELGRVPDLARNGQIDAILVRGSQGSGRSEALGAVAHALGQGVLEVEPAALEKGACSDLLGPLCLLTRSLPVLRCAPGPGETVALPDLRPYVRVLGVIMGQDGGIAGRRAERSLVLTVPAIGRDLRQRHWLEVLQEHAGPDLEVISERFHLPGEHIRRVGALAITQAALHGRPEVKLADVQVACRDLRRQALDSLAVRLDPQGGWDDLVLSDVARAQLRELELRCRHRETLLEHLNPALAHNTGVRALFSGPSGTGKTMTARILASVLGMDLYRVDLAAVINKYIGETEKNLSQVLSRAEELDVILLLDEGDSLLAKRSEVRSSNDRHANMETNYLLQRLEGYRGIVLVTTNFEESIDRAFQRRMDVVVNFTLPQPAERLRIWQAHLPARHAIVAAQLEEVALRCAFTGGQIRNATVKATLLALEAGGSVGWHHLVAAIQGEYNKAGTICPLSPVAGHGGG